MNNELKIFNLLLLPLILLGVITMTIRNCTLIPASIRPSAQFNGAYEVVHYTESDLPAGLGTHLKREVIPCANLATARTIKRELNEGSTPLSHPLPKSVERSLLTAEQLGGCLTGGCGYDPAVTWVATGRVERVHNWATANSLKRNYPVRA